MCGFNGLSVNNLELLKKMSAITESRGPDNSSFYCDQNISLGHNRLSIVDLDDRSNQPYKFKNLIICFNGEIYNFLELKKKLKFKGIHFETNSDTEVIIKIFYYFGLDFVNRLYYYQNEKHSGLSL